jgi:hypothetical protein
MQAPQVQTAEAIELGVAKDADRARVFYGKQGFVLVGEEDWDWPHWTEDRPQNYFLRMRKNLD